MHLFHHQESAVNWLVEHPRGGLFDEQGLGKTISAIVAAMRLGLKWVLVVCPTSITHNWQREFQKWAPGIGTQVIATGSDIIGKNRQVVIVPHGLLLRDKIRAQMTGFDLIILDEGHLFRKPTAQRTKRFYLGADALCRQAPRCWVLTGTPMPNNPSELWTMLAGLAPERLRQDGKLLSWWKWRERFCVIAPDTYKREGKVVGAKNVEELRGRFKGFGMRRLKKEVLDLPAVRWSNVVLTTDDIPTNLEGVDLKSENVLTAIQGHPQFSTWRHACGLAKVPAAVEMLANDLDSGMHKCVVFAHHIDVIELTRLGLQAALGYGTVGNGDVLTLTGSTPPGQRQLIVDRFQSDPRARVLIAQIQAGGIGITLTAAQDAVFIEQSFIPGDNMQAADRIHRIGQTKPVLVRFLSLANSIDEVLVEILARKTQMIREVLK